MKSAFYMIKILISICILCGNYFPTAALAQTQLRIEIAPPKWLPESLADEIHGDLNQELARELKVKITDAGQAVPNKRVSFSLVRSPGNTGKIEIIPAPEVFSDKDGFATVKIKLADKAGEYMVSARLVEENTNLAEKGIVYFRIIARNSQWIFITLMELFAGLAIFLLGIEFLSNGMTKSSGQKLKKILGTVTNNKLIAMLAGIFVTVLFQSSTATTVMLVSMVQAGLLNFVNTLGVILGADIGTTVTVQLISFKLTDYALLGVALGFLMMSVARKDTHRFIGEVVLGIGLVFFGINMMSESVIPLRSDENFLSNIIKFNNPFIAILIGTIFTAVLHSSAAFIGIVIAIATQGFLKAEIGIALCLGANIGTCITALLASVKASTEAKRVAIGHTLFKILGVLLLAPWVTQFAELVKYFGGDGKIERQIANAHTVFNIAIAILFLPFLGIFARLIEFLVPIKTSAPKQPERVILDNSLLNTSVLALSAAKLEVVRLGRSAQKMLEDSLKPLFEDVPLCKQQIHEKESEVDNAYDSIHLYLKKLMSQGLPEDRLEEAYQMLHTSNDLEQIADFVEDSIVPLVEKLYDHKSHLSGESFLELKDYYTKTLKQISRALDVFENSSLEKAKHVSHRFEKYRMLATELRRIHFTRSQATERTSPEVTEIHLALISTLLDISDLATNIARNIINRGEIPVEQKDESPLAKAG